MCTLYGYCWYNYSCTRFCRLHLYLFSIDIQYRNFKLNLVHYHLSHLSPASRELLARLCCFLTLYNKHSAHNKTTVGKLSSVFGPLVLRPTEEEGYVLIIWLMHTLTRFSTRMRTTSFLQSNTTRTKRYSSTFLVISNCNSSNSENLQVLSKC